MGGQAVRDDATDAPRPPLPDRLPIPVVDGHIHLDIRRPGDPDVPLDRRLAEAAAVGVPRAVQIGCDLASVAWTVDVIDRYDALLGGVALHPNEIPGLHASGQLESAYATVEAAARHPRVRVVGETGLDYYRTQGHGIELQQDAFRWHIALAKRLGKVLQIHDRDSHDDVLRILDDEGAPEHVVLHCFSGDPVFAEQCLDRGFFLSFAGTITFKSAAGLRDALTVTPLDRVLVETDAPYLAPVPHRGRPNDSHLVPHTVRAMAAIRGVAVPTLCEAIAASCDRLYGSWERSADG